MPDAIECEHLPTQVTYNDELQLGRDPDEDNEHADELPWDGFWQFVQNLFGYAKRLLQQLSGWLGSDDLGGEDAGCGGPGLVWLHMVCSYEVMVGCTTKFSEMPLAYGREINIKFTGNSSGGHSCMSACQLHAPSKLATSVALCCVIKLHILVWPFIVASLRHTCAIIMLYYLDMPHLWGGWIISAKEKCSLTQIYTDLWTMFERNRPIVCIEEVVDLWVPLM